MIRRTVLAALTACAVLGATDISAQTIGFKVGAAFANWNFDATGVPENATDPLTSLIGGGFIRFGTGPVAFQPELLVVTRGADVSDLGKLKVDYVEVPVLLVLPITRGMGVRPYLMAGPDFAFEIGCNFEAAGLNDSVECNDNDVTSRKSTDIGVTLGGGLEFPLGPGAFLIEGRYNLGLSNLSKDSDVDIKSRTPAVLAGYSIPLTNR